MLMTMHFGKGETIFREGDFADRAFLIESGKVEVTIRDHETQRPVAVLGKGSIFGEMGLITASPRSATVTVTEDCKVISITKGEFENLRKSADPILAELMVKLVNRFRESQEHMVSGSRGPVQEKEDMGEGYSAIVRQRDLTEAVAANEMEPFFQPIINLETRELSGFEGLARWRSGKGFLTPGEFLPMAERTGLIRLIDYTVAKKAMMALGKASGHEDGPDLSLNFSAWHFRDNHLIGVLDELTQVTGFPAHRVKVEITETMVIEDLERSRVIIEALNSRGFQVALDDFGSGYSSMGILQNFNIEVLKIDRSLVESIHSSKRSRSVLKAIVALAADMEMQLVIEGIESQQSLDSLLEMGCGYGQGFLFTRPDTADKIFRDWLGAD